MSARVDHIGKVVSITPQTTTVAFLSHASCSSCSAASLCGMSEVKEKILQLPTDPYASYSAGDEVKIVLKATMGLKAVWLAYFVPLLLLLAVTLGLIWAGVGELVAGFAGILAAGVWYFILWLLRDKLRSEYVFTIQSL